MATMPQREGVGGGGTECDEEKKQRLQSGGKERQSSSGGGGGVGESCWLMFVHGDVQPLCKKSCGRRGENQRRKVE